MVRCSATSARRKAAAAVPDRRRADRRSPWPTSRSWHSAPTSSRSWAAHPARAQHLGDRDSRLAYRDVLVRYLEGRKDRLSEDSLARLERNPMRILDSKDEGDRAVVAEALPAARAPQRGERDFFARVQEGLARLGIAFELNPRLVRGLDYYTHTAFEFTTAALGAQGTVMAGGRYDGLMREMSGPTSRASAGRPGSSDWRCCCCRKRLPPTDRSRDRPDRPRGRSRGGCARPGAARRRRGRLAFKGKPGQRMKRADWRRFAVSLGDDELARGVVRLRDLGSGAEEELRRTTRRPACRLTGRPMVAPGFDPGSSRSWPAATSSKRWPRSSRASTPGSRRNSRTSGRWSRPSRPTAPRGASCAISRR